MLKQQNINSPDCVNLASGLDYKHTQDGPIFTIMKLENFKKIKGFEDYEISNMGNVKSFKRTVPIFLKGGTTNKGYKRVSIYSNDNLVKSYFIHRLVAFAFIPNPLNKLQINHKNGIKADNRVENLEWVTSFENMEHAHKTKLIQRPSGINHWGSKQVAQYTMEGRLIQVFGSILEAERLTGIGSRNISHICNNTRKPKNFNWKFYY